MAVVFSKSRKYHCDENPPTLSLSWFKTEQRMIEITLLVKVNKHKSAPGKEKNPRQEHDRRDRRPGVAEQGKAPARQKIPLRQESIYFIASFDQNRATDE